MKIGLGSNLSLLSYPLHKLKNVLVLVRNHSDCAFQNTQACQLQISSTTGSRKVFLSVRYRFIIELYNKQMQADKLLFLFLTNIQTTIITNAKGKRNKGTIVLLANVHNGITLVRDEDVRGRSEGASVGGSSTFSRQQQGCLIQQWRQRAL